MTGLIERLHDDPRVKTAAMIADNFKIDPLVVLRSDHFDFALRTACLGIVAEQREKNQPKQPK